VVGGHGSSSAPNSVEVYDTSAGQWRALPDMSVARQACSAVCIDGNVYVMGGFDGGSYLKSAEMYGTSAGQWRALPDMSVAISGCAAVYIDGNVYVMGGHGSGSFLKSAEMYDTSAGQWRALPDMSVARNGCAALCIDGNVYICDGRTRQRVLFEERRDVRHLGGAVAGFAGHERGEARIRGGVHRWERVCCGWQIRCRNRTCEHGVLRRDRQRVAHAAEHEQH
jgi:N-acetylneuraminic acid mutarotase